MARILYIEDDESVRKLGERILRKKKHDVIVRESTDKAIAIASIFKPDIIITDHELGTEETGLMFAEKAKHEGFNVVMLTGTDVSKEARNLGVQVFMKPYNIANIVEEVMCGKLERND